MNCRHLHLPAMLVTLAFAAACEDNGVSGPQYVAEAPFDFVVSPTGQRSLDLQAITGSIEITRGAAGSDFSIQGLRRVKANSRTEAEERLVDLQVEVEETSEALMIRTLQPSRANGIQYEVEYEISVPPEIFLQVSQITGAVLIRSARSGVDVRNITGSVALEDVECSAAVSLTTGSLVAAVALPLDGALELTVVTGTMALSIPSTTSAVLRASVVTGSMSFTDLTIVDMDSRQNFVEATLGAGEGEIDLSCVTGSIVVVGR